MSYGPSVIDFNAICDGTCDSNCGFLTDEEDPWIDDIVYSIGYDLTHEFDYVDFAPRCDSMAMNYEVLGWDNDISDYDLENVKN